MSTRGSCEYEMLVGEILEIPLVWKSDLDGWLTNMRKGGEIDIPELKGRQRTAKPGYSIIWKAK